MKPNKGSLLDKSIRSARGSRRAPKCQIKVDATLQLLKYLGLANETRSALGWEETDLLIRLHAKKILKQPPKYGTGDFIVDQVVTKLLCDAAWPGTSRQYKELVSSFALTVLESFGLMKRDDLIINVWHPSEWLCDLLRDKDLLMAPIVLGRSGRRQRARYSSRR